MQALQIFGSVWELSILPRNLSTGDDFGYTSLMNTLTRLMLKGRLPDSKRRLVRGSDVRCFAILLTCNCCRM
eukprot:6207301-Pleurochrysis_carterae.AAC.1